MHAKMKTHISTTAQRLEDEVESRPWHGWPGILAWRWVGRANKLDINFFGHKLGASANMIYWFADSVRLGTERPRAVEQACDAAPSTPSTQRPRAGGQTCDAATICSPVLYNTGS